MDGGSSEQAITMQIQENALEQMLEVEDAVTASFEDLDFVVEAFHKTAILALDEEVGNLLPPGLEQFQKSVSLVFSGVD